MFLQAAFDHITIGRSRNTGMICISTGKSESVEEVVAGSTNSPHKILDLNHYMMFMYYFS